MFVWYRYKAIKVSIYITKGKGNRDGKCIAFSTNFNFYKWKIFGFLNFKSKIDFRIDVPIIVPMNQNLQTVNIFL